MKHPMPSALFSLSLGMTLAAASPVPAARPATAPTRLTPTTQFSALTPLPCESTGTLITLRLKNATARETYDALATQGQTTFSAWPPNVWDDVSASRITVDFQNVPWWETMRQVCPKLGMYPLSGEPRVILTTRLGETMFDGRACQRGPVLLVADRLERTHAVAFAKPGNVGETCEIRFNLFIEPRLGVLRRSEKLVLTEAVDDKGHALITGDVPEAPLICEMGCSDDVKATLPLPEGTGKRLAHLKGILRLSVQAKSRTWEAPVAVGQLAASYEIAGRRMVVESVERDKLLYALDWSVFRNGTGDRQWSKMCEIMLPKAPGVRLMDAQGLFDFRYDRSPAESDGDHLTFHFDFRKDRRKDHQQPSDPVKLVWEEVQETREMTLPFEFTDLPLP